MKTAIINTNIVMTDGVIQGGTIVIENGVIVDFGNNISTDGMSCIDANGAYTGPGLIDIHVHACGPDFFFNKPIEAADAVLSHGVTDVLPTLYFDMTKEQLVEQAQTIRAAMESGKAKNIIGIYMEGPYLNPKYGCNTEYNTWRGVVARENYEKLVDSAYDIVKVWCIAPERENIEEFVDYVRSKNPSAVFSVAHSEAEPEQVERFIPMGLILATHHMNATGKLEKYGGCRTACVDEAALYNDEIYTELICDKLGIHVSPYMLKFVKKIKGDDKIILIANRRNGII